MYHCTCQTAPSPPLKQSGRTLTGCLHTAWKLVVVVVHISVLPTCLDCCSNAGRNLRFVSCVAMAWHPPARKPEASLLRIIAAGCALYYVCERQAIHVNARKCEFQKLIMIDISIKTSSHILNNSSNR